MDAIVQCMSNTDDFHHILQSMQEDADWPTGKAWKTWKNIQKHYQPMDSTSARDLTMALQKIKLKKDANPMKILSDISAVEVRFKQALSKERKIEVVQGCAEDDYAQIIAVADRIAQIQSIRNAKALELCKAMRNLWRIAGHDNDDKEDDDVDNDSMGLKTSLGTVRDK
jgi:hypothetical protein